MEALGIQRNTLIYGGHSSYEALLETSTVVVDEVATSKSREYDVFVNCEWGDHMTFVVDLIHELITYGLRPYFGIEVKAKMPSEEAIEAIKGACVHVAIFSKEYVESEDCLDYLCEMLKSEQRIFPVFYDIKKSDLQRIEDGPYEEAFMNHKKHGRDKKIPTWKEALRKVADYKGFIMDEVDG